MSKLQKEKKRERKVEETKDILDAIGQKNEKEGIRWTKFFMDKFEKEEWKKDQLKEDKLRKSRIKRKDYHSLLAKMLFELLSEFEKPVLGAYNQVVAYPTNLGVVAQFKDKLGRVWQKAFRPCGVPKIDYHAVKTISGLAEDRMYQLEEQKMTPAGIWLP